MKIKKFPKTMFGKFLSPSGIIFTRREGNYLPNTEFSRLIIPLFRDERMGETLLEMPGRFQSFTGLAFSKLVAGSKKQKTFEKGLISLFLPALRLELLDHSHRGQDELLSS